MANQPNYPQRKTVVSNASPVTGQVVPGATPDVINHQSVSESGVSESEYKNRPAGIGPENVPMQREMSRRASNS